MSRNAVREEEKMETTFSAGQVVKLTGISSYDALDYWSDFLPPSTKSKGGRRRYCFRDVVVIRVAVELRTLGISLQALRKVVDFCRQTQGLNDSSMEARLVLAGEDLLYVVGEAELMSVLRRRSQSCVTIVLDLGQTVAMLKARRQGDQRKEGVCRVTTE